MAVRVQTDAGARPDPTWMSVLVLPLIGLAILLLRPELDVEWEHHPSHFWLVLGTAAVSVVLASLTNVAAGRSRDARIVLVSGAFLAAAGFLGLHALATPGVLLHESNAGFVIATPFGLAVAAGFAAASVSPWAGPHSATVLRLRRPIVAILMAVLACWAALSLVELPPFDGPPPDAESVGLLRLIAVVTVAVDAYVAWRYVVLYRRRGGIVLLTVAAAFALLGEAMIAVALSRNWRLSWWEWHLLMLLAFVAIAVGVRREYRSGGSVSAAFGGLYLDATLARIDRWHAGAIAAVARAEALGEGEARVLAALRQEGATDEEVRLLVEAARALRRLDESFRPFLPSVVASGIRAAGPPRLGGVERDVTVVFADLTGFTSFSETRRPTDVIAMLNEFWAAIVPVIDRAGGVIEQFAGDGVMVIFNAAGDQPDHPTRGARTALAIVAAARAIVARHPDWPTFRVGVNSGPAVVGTVGAAKRRSFATIGDTTNVAARLMATAEPGGVVVARSTWEALPAGRAGRELGPIAIKGKRAPVDAVVVTDAG